VEHSPGKKDPVKVKNIIQMIREIKTTGLREVNTSDSRIFTGTL
jgi:hypothetical protein